MTTYALDRLSKHPETRSWPLPSIRNIGKETLARINSAHIAFEASATRATSSPEGLQQAANRGDLDPEVRNRLVAQHAIRHF